MKKLISVLCLTIMVLVGLVGCKKQGDTSEPLYDPNQKINVGEIGMDVSMGVSYGDRGLMCKFTNNSKYTITDLTLVFKLKEGVSKEKIDEIIEHIAVVNRVSEEDKEYMKNIELKIEAGFTTWGEDNLAPGESNTDEMNYYGWYFVDNMDYYDLFTPDIMTIDYLDENGKKCITYYDYINRTYTNKEW